MDGWMDIIRREKRVAEQQSSSVEDAAGVGRAGPIAVAAAVQHSVSSVVVSFVYGGGRRDENALLAD